MILTTSDGIQYQTDKYGVIHQLNPEPFTYDANYVSTYDTEAYKRNEDILCALRFGFVCAAHGRPPDSLLDYGCGNLAFVNFARRLGYGNFVGYDIAEREGVVKELKPAEVYTFWDALEHVPDLSFVRKLKCETVVISLPNMLRGLDSSFKFDTWKHRKPNEHLHHFNELSLRRFMASVDWCNVVAVSHHEDIIRKPVNGLPNILTMAFKR